MFLQYDFKSNFTKNKMNTAQGVLGFWGFGVLGEEVFLGKEVMLGGVR